jgi:hypothetical protein
MFKFYYDQIINRSLLSHMEKLSVAQVERLLWSRRGSNPGSTFRPVVQRFYQLSHPARQGSHILFGYTNMYKTIRLLLLTSTKTCQILK